MGGVEWNNHRLIFGFQLNVLFTIYLKCGNCSTQLVLKYLTRPPEQSVREQMKTTLFEQ